MTIRRSLLTTTLVETQLVNLKNKHGGGWILPFARWGEELAATDKTDNIIQYTHRMSSLNVRTHFHKRCVLSFAFLKSLKPVELGLVAAQVGASDMLPVLPYHYELGYSDNGGLMRWWGRAMREAGLGILCVFG